MAVPLPPVEAVPADAFLRGRLEALVVFHLVLPLDLGGVEAEAEIGRFAAGAGPGVEGDDASGVDGAAYAFVPRAPDVLPGLDQEPEQSLALLVTVFQFIPAGLRVALLAGEVQDLAH